CDAERLQFLVAFGDVGVTAAGEVATGNVSSGERVTDSFLLLEVSVQNLLLFIFRQFGESFACAVVQSAANAKRGLVRLRRINEDAGLRLQWLSEMFEGQGVGG